MSQWDDKVWTLIGAHPVHLHPTHRATPIEVLVVQRGHQLATNVVDGKVKVDSLDSSGELIRELGRFDIVNDRTIHCQTKIDGVVCCIELTIANLRRSGGWALLTGLICPDKKPNAGGGEEGAVGGFSAEVQGGYEGDSGS